MSSNKSPCKMAAQVKSSPSLPQIITILLVVGLVITALVSVVIKKPTSHQGHEEQARGKTEGSSSASSCQSRECLHQKEKREVPPPPPPLCIEEKFDKLPKSFLISEIPIHIITKGGKQCFLQCMDEPPPPCVIKKVEDETLLDEAKGALSEETEEEAQEEEEKEISEEVSKEGEEIEEKEEAETEVKEFSEEIKETEEESDKEVEDSEVEGVEAEGEEKLESVAEDKAEESEENAEDEEKSEKTEAEEEIMEEEHETEEVAKFEESEQDEAEEQEVIEDKSEEKDVEESEQKDEEKSEEKESEENGEEKEDEEKGGAEEETEKDEIEKGEETKDEEKSEEKGDEEKEEQEKDEEKKSEEKETEQEKEEAEGEEKEFEKEQLEDEEGIEEISEKIEEIFEHKRITDYIDELLHLDKESMVKETKLDKYANDILKRLQKIYHNTIKPIEKTYKFTDLYGYTFSDGELFAKPMILVIGPWSSGKTAFINYLLDIETGAESLLIGAEPTTTDFTIIQNGEEFRAVDGPVLTQDSSFSTLEKFGRTFLDRLKGYQFSRQILKKMTIIDTPGIIEGQERSYPFSDVCQWFVDHSDLIIVMFDPTKLDVGNELDDVFKKLKGREPQIRIILNKADSLAQQELMRVYGALYWSLSQLIENLEPPRVYVGSFWSRPFKSNAPVRLFLDEEVSLLKDFNDVFDNRVMNKINMLRQHAIRVRNHALLVDKYLAIYNSHNSFFANSKEIAHDIIQNPNKYRIYQAVSMQTNVSKFDLPDPHEYEEFFAVNPLHKFRTLTSQCSFFRGCPLDKLEHAVTYDLPDLLVETRDSRNKQCGTGKYKCPADEDKKRRLVKRR